MGKNCYEITIGNGQKFTGRGYTFEDVLQRHVGDVRIKDLYPIRVFIRATEPTDRDEVNSE